MVIRKYLLLVGFLVFFSAASQAIGGEPIYFRGDFGIVPGAPVTPTRFDEGSTIWRIPLQRGHSTPTIVGDSIFLTTFDPLTKKHETVALDRKTGHELWRQPAPAPRVEEQHQFGSPASATVASDGERIYVFFGSYGLLCYELSGKQVWAKPMGPFQDEFGSSSSPILIGEKLLLSEDHDIDNFLMAIDKNTSKTLWRVSRDEYTRSYSTPVLWRHDGRTEVIVAGAVQLASYDLDSGDKLWWVNGLARIVNTTPVVHGDQIIVATWSPGGDSGQRIGLEPWDEAAKKHDKNADGKIALDELDGGPVVPRFFRMDLDQDGKIDQAEWERHADVFARAENSTLAIRAGGSGNVTDSAVIWKTPTGAPYVSSPLLHDGVVYLAKDGGIFTTLDAETGGVIKRGRLRGRGNYFSSPVLVGDKVLVASQRGVLSVVTAVGEWEMVASHDFGEGISATPVFNQGHLFIRTEEALYCFAGGGGK